MKQDPDGQGFGPHGPGLDPSLGPSGQPNLAYQSHTGPDLIGAVHIQAPMSHLPTHMAHMYGLMVQSPSTEQSPESMGAAMMEGIGVKGGYSGGAGFGFVPYADAEALSKLRGHPAWESEVGCSVQDELTTSMLDI